MPGEYSTTQYVFIEHCIGSLFVNGFELLLIPNGLHYSLVLITTNYYVLHSSTLQEFNKLEIYYPPWSKCKDK